MARSKKGKQDDRGRQPSARLTDADPVARPLLVARALCGVLLVVGLVMVGLGAGVLVGKIREGWGFPMSAVPNFGRIWGLALIAAGVAYIVGPVLMFLKPSRGAVVMMIVSGLSVVLGVPLMTSTVEIFYNLFQTTKSQPPWVDSVWGYFLLVNVGICVAVYRTYPLPDVDEGNEPET